MTVISKKKPLVTLINVFEVDPPNQEKLIDLLVKATEETMNKFPGFISANIHRSLDGSKVVNYAQWRSREDFAAMLKNPDAQKHMQEAYQLTKRIDPHLYEVVYIDHVAEKAA